MRKNDVSRAEKAKAGVFSLKKQRNGIVARSYFFDSDLFCKVRKHNASGAEKAEGDFFSSKKTKFCAEMAVEEVGSSNDPGFARL